MTDEEHDLPAVLLPVRLPDGVSEREAAEFEAGLAIIGRLVAHMHEALREQRPDKADMHE